MTAPATGDVLGRGFRYADAAYQWSSEAPGAFVVHGDQRCDVELLHDARHHGRQSGTKYEVAVSNAAGSVTSNRGDTDGQPGATAPVITTQPASRR